MPNYAVSIDREAMKHSTHTKDQVSTQRRNVKIIDRLKEGNQEVLTMANVADVALADKICDFLNSDQKTG